MRNIFRIIVSIIMAVFLIAVSLNSLSGKGLTSNGTINSTVQKKLNQIDPSGSMAASSNVVVKAPKDINSLPLEDNLEIYQNDDPGSVVTMYLTVRRGNDLEDTDHSWQEVNDVNKYLLGEVTRIIPPKAEAILQVGDENGPKPGELGYGSMITNATVQVRGNSTTRSPQKSYKISLFNNAGAWRGQQTINLNKSVFDPTRMKNKLSFDLIKGMPDMVSLRTQFVHLYVKDETADPPGQAFEDYGLFTQIEMPNKTFLKNHLLDRYGQLYKANLFEFKRYPDQIRLASDPQYNEEDFSSVLEIQGSKDHSKLIKMLDDVNNWAIPIEQTFEKYFDEDNYFTWMAFNILAENVDTNTQNFYLYSPQNSQKWYFIPWDYDGAWDRQEHMDLISPYQQGISTYWNDVLHRRVLSVPEYRDKLVSKVDELMGLLTPDRINQLVNIYNPVVDNYIFRMPDIQRLYVTPAEHERLTNLLAGEPAVNYQLFLDNLEKPMPYFLGTPTKQDNKLRYNWEEAYDFKAQDITYRLEVSTGWDFETLVYEGSITNITYLEMPELQPGTYFWRVIATNEDGKTQYPFDFYIDSQGTWHYGMKYLYITSTGDILEKQFEQQ